MGDAVGFVVMEVAGSAEPDDEEGEGIIGVMHLGIGGATDVAGLAGEVATFEVDFGVGTGVGAATGFGGGRVREPPISHVGGVTGAAVTPPGPRVSAALLAGNLWGHATVLPWNCSTSQPWMGGPKTFQPRRARRRKRMRCPPSGFTFPAPGQLLHRPKASQTSQRTQNASPSDIEWHHGPFCRGREEGFRGVYGNSHGRGWPGFCSEDPENSPRRSGGGKW